MFTVLNNTSNNRKQHSAVRPTGLILILNIYKLCLKRFRYCNHTTTLRALLSLLLTTNSTDFIVDSESRTHQPASRAGSIIDRGPTEVVSVCSCLIVCLCIFTALIIEIAGYVYHLCSYFALLNPSQSQP